MRRLVAGFFILAFTGFAQTNIVTQPGQVIIQQGGGRIVIQGGTLIQGGQVFTADPRASADPLVQLMMSQPQVDTNVLIAVAEFDPPTVVVGARTTYRIVITALEDTIRLPEKLPAPSGLRLEASGRGQSLQNLGGLVQARSTFNHRAVALNAGTLLMPSFSVDVGGRKVAIPEARLTALPVGASAPTQPRLTLEMPTNDIYIGQSVVGRLLMADGGDNPVLALTQAHIVGDGLLAERGFSRMNRSVVMRDGRPVTTMSTDLLITPMREGLLKVFGQANVVLRQFDPGRYAHMPGYYPLFDTEPVVANVRRVPKEGQLPGYTGAIGMFVVEPPQLSASEIQAGDPVKFQVVIRGEGNFGRFTAPMPEPGADWQIFPPDADANAGNQVPGQGFAAFTYTMIPLSDRVRSTPKIPFSAFAPEHHSHYPLTIPTLSISVKPAPGGLARTRAPEIAAAPDAEPSEAPLELAGAMKVGGGNANLTPLQQRGWFLALQLAPALVLGGLWWWDRRRRFLAAHPEIVRKRRARRALARGLRHARHAAARNDGGGFVTAAVDALRAAAAPHEAANPQALVGRDVVRELPAGASAEDAELIRRLFNAADAQRITHRSEGAALAAAERDFERVAQRLEERLE